MKEREREREKREKERGTWAQRLRPELETAKQVKVLRMCVRVGI